MKTNPTLIARLALATAASLVLAGQAMAQFPGDAFFSSPSVSTPAGEDAVVRVKMFSGTDAFGAARMEIRYDESEFEITEIRQVPNITWSNKSYAVEEPGKLSLAIFNDSSLTTPTGSVELIELVVRPKLAAGGSGELSISSVETLMANHSPYPSADGFEMTIEVTAASAPSAAPLARAAASAVAPATAAPTGAIERVPYTQLTTKVPPGTRLRVWKSKVDTNGRTIWSCPEVQTYDPTAPSD